ncbi:hypothetical protein [Thalassolituus hydrocarboniclasticus]|uniref:Kinase n=1 Tax=Thalassolituus hydrocarboniclasticus TaxID=2742796 RepID=A0ABY6ACX2_9GAMM|nr:hypothetical protein [Thalassolituus hydrocarboniclasticus]UXD88507.1 hypothetical protein HUF19_14195 [Thalassolituus hydrocarboniclasticus]
MNEQQPAAQDVDYTKWIGLGFIAGIIIAVLALEYYGYIKHPSEQDSSVVDEFRLLAITPENDLKISPKNSGKTAFCVGGYLLLRPDNGKEVAGILVDQKNRGIHCRHDMSIQADSSTANDGAQQQ